MVKILNAVALIIEIMNYICYTVTMKNFNKVALAAAIVCLMIFSCPASITASADWSHFSPIYGLMLVDHNDSLSVVSETLNLEPSASLSDQYSQNMPDTLFSEYEIRNDAASSVCRIAIPTTEQLNSNYENYKLTANEVILEPCVYYTNKSSLLIDDIDNLFSSTFTEAVVFDDSLCGILYEITATSSVEVDFILEENQRLVTNANFHTYNSSTRAISIGASDGKLSIFLNTGTLNINEKTENTVITSSTISYNTFLEPYIEIEQEDESKLPYSIFASNILNSFFNDSYSYLISFSDLIPPSSGFIFLVYSVEFTSGLNSISVERPIDYSISYKTDPPKYYLHFDNVTYNTWSSFGNTTLNVTTPENLPYIINDDIEFQKTASNSYIFHGDLTIFDEYSVFYCSVKNPKEPNTPTWRTILLVSCIVIISIASVALVVCIIQIIRDKKRSS